MFFAIDGDLMIAGMFYMFKKMQIKLFSIYENENLFNEIQKIIKGNQPYYL